jgi:hypothetical protein
MTDDAIRDLLATVTSQTMDLRPGYLAAWFGHVEAQGGDVKAVREWVEAHDGRVDNPPRPDRMPGLPGLPVAPTARGDTRRFVFPASALEADA